MKARLEGKPDVSALNDLGVYFGEQKDYTCAANAFASSLQMDPQQKSFAHVAFMFGASLYLSGDTKDAIAALQEAEKFGYNDIKLHLILAQALDTTHATADAETEWRAALEIDPEYPDALDNLSSDLIADGNCAAVIELLDAPRIAPLRNEQQDMNLALAYARTGKLNDSARVLRDSVNTYPDSARLSEQLANVLTELGSKEEAAAVLQIANDRQAKGSEADH
jgi:Flp pilus assembly protein TadD